MRFSSHPTRTLLLKHTPKMSTLLFLLLHLSHASPNLVHAESKSPALPRPKPVTLFYTNGVFYSPNKTFQLGFFNLNSNWYLGIWYAEIPTPSYVWVANRETPFRNVAGSRLEIGKDGFLAVVDDTGGVDSVMWRTYNEEAACEVRLLESGNLVLESCEGDVVWQSFDYPTDTFLPGMNLSSRQSLTCWKSVLDPSPGFYSLRLKPPEYGELELVFNRTVAYWSTGNWIGDRFVGVPEMTIVYIYKFHFVDAFSPDANFGYTEVMLDAAVRPPLTRFHLDYNGQLKQFTWSPQLGIWNMFWSQPESKCRVYGLCGEFGICSGRTMRPCECLTGFSPVDVEGWGNGDYSGGCRRKGGLDCSVDDEFANVGFLVFDGAFSVALSGSRSFCEDSCLRNCSCIGLSYNSKNNVCKNVFGSLLNSRNLTSVSTMEDALYLRVRRGGRTLKSNAKMNAALITTVIGSLIVLAISVIILFVFGWLRHKRKKQEGDYVFRVTNLRVFSYKELNAVTKSFSEKLGHGGFGAVFKGELPDSSLVAVKRLERPGDGEKEFRAEVCTIGNIQHLNLVRLRGFCSENSHRLLVYDYMENGPLSSYLRRDGPSLSWDVRFRVAVGTARAVAYLHEGCRDCIIHCDIKPENILLDSDFSAKVSDFGLAKLIGRDFSRIIATMRGTWGYVAPEWISGVAITTKADVYSYGMTLLELISGRRNVEVPPSSSTAPEPISASGRDKWFFPPYAAQLIIEGNTAAVMDDRLNSAYNASEAERVGLVAIWCIQDDEESRPTMGSVVKMLEGIVEVTVPPQPKLIQALVSGEPFPGVKPPSRDETLASNDSTENLEVSISGGYNLSAP
ncbi:hypothetical protein QQ045_028734 [Rhodiola kirilowii]